MCCFVNVKMLLNIRICVGLSFSLCLSSIFSTCYMKELKVSPQDKYLDLLFDKLSDGNNSVTSDTLRKFMLQLNLLPTDNHRENKHVTHDHQPEPATAGSTVYMAAHDHVPDVHEGDHDAEMKHPHAPNIIVNKGHTVNRTFSKVASNSVYGSSVAQTASSQDLPFRVPLQSKETFQCNRVAELLGGIGIQSNTSLSKSNILALCPGILLALLENCTVEDGGAGDTKKNLYCHHEGHGHSHHEVCSTEEYRSREMWIAAFSCMLLIGVIGFGCIFMIPALKKGKYYMQIHHFLVSLAVGSLSGDALLHLLPHAISMDQVNHIVPALYGFTSFLGIIIFLFLERSHNLFGQRHSDHRTFGQEKELGRLSLDNGRSEDKSDNVFSVSKSQESPKCFDGCPPPSFSSANDSRVVQTSEQHLQLNDDAVASVAEREKLVAPSSNKSMEDGKSALSSAACEVLIQPSSSTFSYTQQEYIMGHHGHSHHGHSHISGKKESLKAMVLLGDAVHTFMDGVAIGAAFGISLTGGLATALAVLCHELPHKVGDFALLYEMGMSRRVAIKMMTLLWVLSVIGLVVGIFVGSINYASPWIYSFTAGIFLYLALVDLLSELSPNADEVCGILGQMGLQILGMSSGAVVMLIIAVYEHSLEDLFRHSF